MRTPVAALLLLSLSGCSSWLGKLDAVEAALEPKVDEAVNRTVRRVCRLPVDITLRQVERRGPEYLEALVLMCPEWKAVAEALGEMEDRRNVIGQGR